MATNGIIFIHWSDPVYESIHSGAFARDNLIKRATEWLKYSNPDLHYTIVDVSPTISPLLTDSDKTGFAFLYRPAEIWANTPYENTLYLDIDTCVLRDISHMFELIDRYNIVVPICESPLASRYFKCPQATNLIEYNCGVLGFKKNIICERIFRDWTYFNFNVDSSVRVGKSQQVCNDQLGFTLSLNKHSITPFALPNNYNYRLFWHRALIGKMFIWHNMFDPPQNLIDNEGHMNCIIQNGKLMLEKVVYE